MTEKIAKKFRFLPLLPFGICSKQALYLVLRTPEAAIIPYSPDVPMSERERAYKCSLSATTTGIRRMLETGYIEESVRKYGDSKASIFRAITLTKAGFNLLCGYPLDRAEYDRINSLGDISYHKLSTNTYQNLSAESENVREMNLLRQQENNLTPKELKKITQAFYSAVRSGEMTILAYNNSLAADVNINNPRYNGKRQYRNWRLANINALFIANDFLTYIDRRPMNTNWSVGSVYDEESFDSYLESGDLDIPAYVQRTLSKWYDDHPKSMRFMDPLPDTVDMDAWKRTPVFYSTLEIPGFYVNSDEVTAGQKNKIIHSLAGVAIGRKMAYIVHHTKHNKTPWGYRWERTTIEVVQNALQEANVLSPSGEPFKIQEAIVVCGSIGQFEDFYESTRDNIAKRWQKDRKIGAPYDTICMVPLNGSGSMQIRYLMMLSPHEMDLSIANILMQSDSRFTRNHESLFMLSFEGTPVLLAHSMQLQQLYDAQQKYEEGMEFYVCCYPGQVQYIRRLMPNVKFL